MASGARKNGRPITAGPVVLRCDLNTAKERVLKRNADNLNELFIDENAFNILLQQYEPLSEEENYPAVFISSHPLSD